MAVWALWTIIVYYVTSSRAKANTAAFKEKVLRMVEILKARVERLEHALRAAETAQRAAEDARRAAEARASDAEQDADEARKQAATERERAKRAEALVRALQDRIRAVEAERARWAGEQKAAESLGLIAGAALSVAVVLEVRGIVAGSVLLSAHKADPHGALDELDRDILAAAAIAKMEGEVVDAAVEGLAHVTARGGPDPLALLGASAST